MKNKSRKDGSVGIAMFILFGAAFIAIQSYGTIDGGSPIAGYFLAVIAIAAFLTGLYALLDG